MDHVAPAASNLTVRGVALVFVMTLAAGMLPRAAVGSDAGQAMLAAEGERLWTTSPDPANPVACATCHHVAADTRGWAASFPKFRALPPPHARVMTLLQANAEAARRHYRLADPRPAAAAITAYLTTHGARVPLSPGVVAGQPVFPARLRALTQAVARGRHLYASACAACHQAETISAAITGFPRTHHGAAESLEDFLDRHVTPRGLLPWDSPEMADVISYLVAELAGRSPKGCNEEP